MWTDDYFNRVKKFRKDMGEFESGLYDMPDEICEHTKALQYAIQDFRIVLAKYIEQMGQDRQKIMMEVVA